MVLVFTAVSRFTGLNWDDYHHYHPDERYISWVAATIEWPESWQTAFNPQRSSFNPYYWPENAESRGIVVPQDEPRDFAYGHLPLYLGAAATRLAERISPVLRLVLPVDSFFAQDVLNGAERIEFKHLTAVSRALTALVDLLTVLMTFLLGKRLFGAWAGLLAAAFLSLAVLHIQLAHFFAVDPYLTFFVVTAVYFLVSGAAQTTGKYTFWHFLAAAIMIGLAVGSKFSGIMLLLPLYLAVWLQWSKRWGRWALGLTVIVFATFFVTNPFAVLDWSCGTAVKGSSFWGVTIPSFSLGNCYLDNILTQQAMVSGRGDVAFTRQYVGTRPFLYQVEMLLRWGLGWPLGVAAFIGLVWALWQGLAVNEFRLKSSWQAWTRALARRSQLLIVFAWVLPYTLSTSSFFVKFMRYMQPVVPFLLIFAAGFIVSLPVRWRWLAGGAVIVPTAVYAIAFLNIYNQPHPWVQASLWVYENIPPGTTLLSEEWDDALPSSMVVNGRPRRRSEYKDEALRWHTRRGEADDLAKLEANLTLLAESEYVTILSNRLYGTAPRLPEKYPLSSQYHQLLFDGSLGYEVVAVFGRFPHIGTLYIKPDTFGWPRLTPPEAVSRYLAQFSGLTGGRTDESFVVYDQPLTMIFQNTGHLTVDEMRARFDLSAADQLP
ncbi:MAG: hypothetical protein Kow0080_09670 [Candidatus Promineifilaceae bacterium]